MKRYGIVVGFVMALMVMVAMGAYTGWKYNAEDLYGSTCIQARLDAIHTLITATWTNAINTTVTDGLQANSKAAVVTTNSLSVMVALESVTNGQAVKLFPVAFGAAPKGWAQWRENVTAIPYVGTTNLGIYISTSTTNFTVTTGMPAGSAGTNIDIVFVGDAP